MQEKLENKIHFYLSLLLVKTAKETWGIFFVNDTFFCLSLYKRNQKKQIPNFNLRLFNLMALVATYDGNLLAFNEIFCAIKGALCRELWAPYFSSSEVRSPNISQAYITHKSEGSNCKQVPITMCS